MAIVRQVSSIPGQRARHVWGWSLIGLLAAILMVDERSEPGASGNVLILLGVVVVQLLALQGVTRLFETRGQVGVGRGIALAMGTSSVMSLITMAVLAQMMPSEEMSISGLIISALLQAVVMVGLWMVGFRYPYIHARLLEAQTLEREAELFELRSRLQPHFLGNSLNAIAGLVTQDPERARQLLADLGELMRELASTTSSQRALREELGWVRRYTALLEARHAGDLEVRWDISPEIEDAMVPSFLVQPLVENAVLHGSLGSHHASPAVHVVTISAHREGPALVLQIENAARAAAACSGQSSDPPREGTGLTLVRARLRLWQPSATFELRQRDDRFVATLRAPYLRASAASV
jgi:hypothetical protein